MKEQQGKVFTKDVIWEMTTSQSLGFLLQKMGIKIVLPGRIRELKESTEASVGQMLYRSSPLLLLCKSSPQIFQRTLAPGERKEHMTKCCMEKGSHSMENTEFNSYTDSLLGAFNKLRGILAYRREYAAFPEFILP